jgi:hypothetical protein
MISIADARRGALDAIDRHVNTGPDPETVLRRSTEVLVERLGYAFVAVRRPGAGDVYAGEPPSAATRSFPIVLGAEEVGVLLVDGAGDGDREFLEHVARMLSSRCAR